MKKWIALAATTVLLATVTVGSAAQATTTDDAQVRFYVDTPAPKKTLAKYEPATGTYIGMFASDKQTGSNISNVKGVFGKQHSMFLTYVGWRYLRPESHTYFPIVFANKAKASGAAIQIGLEPSNGLQDVKDDAYLRQFAREAKAYGGPVFLRYASEMNGNWVKWYGNPTLYKEKWRLVHKIMKEEAPNVVMVWSPNVTPTGNIDAYYPGDAYVDWVGLSLYQVPYSNGKDVTSINQIDQIKSFYNKYSKKPIMISEGAVSSYNLKLKKNYNTWAVGQIGNMYGYLPKMFPQIKAITYFNFSKTQTIKLNKTNIYDLGEVASVNQEYKRQIKSGYFIPTVKQGATSSDNKKYVPVTGLKNYSGVHKLFTYISLPQGAQPAYVMYYHNGKRIATSYGIPWEISVNLSKLNKKYPIVMKAFDAKSKLIVTKSIYLNK